MSILTISTPVSGVNNSRSTRWGPLESLYGSIDQVDFLKYPRDLESSTRSHSVLFTIKEIQEVSLDEVRSKVSELVDSFSSNESTTTTGVWDNLKDVNWQNLTTTVRETTQETVAGVTQAVKNPAETIKSAFNTITSNLQNVGEQGSRLRQIASSRRTNTKGFIALYMPENVSFSYDPNYSDNVTLASVAGATPLIGRAVSTITGAMENDLIKFVLNKAGYVFNPEAQVLFNGISFRNFSMSFTFTPYSKKEAEDVRRIIKMFRTHAAPRRVTSAGGMFFIPPSIFNIDFNFKGTPNGYLNKVGDCVIENIDVNYTPNGWSAHEDGAPVQTVVTLQFKEIVLVDRDMIDKQGF